MSTHKTSWSIAPRYLFIVKNRIERVKRIKPGYAYSNRFYKKKSFESVWRCYLSYTISSTSIVEVP